MRKIHVVALALFAWTMIGAQSCFDDYGNMWSNKNPVPTTSRPFCLTDPPYACAVVCLGPDLPGFTDGCADVPAGPLTSQFEDTVELLANMAAAADKQICPPDNLQGRLTPCSVGIAPVEWPNQDHSVCMSAPPSCAP